MPAHSLHKHIGKRPADRLQKLGVMVLDPNATVAQLYRGVLQRLGFKDIHLVDDGFEGVQLLKKCLSRLCWWMWN